MNFVKNWSIKLKMMVIMVVPSSVALLTACGTLLFFQSVSLRQDIARDLSALGEVIATQSTAAVAFSDQQAATEILKALRVKPQIVGAQIDTLDGKAMATYGQAPRTQIPQLNTGVIFDDQYIFLKHAIRLDSKPIGVLYLQADFRTTYIQLMTFYGKLLAAVTLVSMLLITLLSTFFQRIITQPVLKLAGTAASIAENRDYSLRAEKFGNDEIGGLTEAFNLMLSQIQAQDRALNESRERFEVAVSGSRDGLWDWDLTTDAVYYSPRWKSMLGYEESEIGPTFPEFVRLIHPEDKDRVINHINSYLASDHETYESVEFRMLQNDGDYRWILSRGAAQRDTEGKPYRLAGSHTDITERKRSDSELERINQQLLKISRQAGMADVATGVLHNVGNVLNSVNVSATLVADRIRSRKTVNLQRAIALLNDNLANATDFLSSDPKGKVLPGYLNDLSNHLAHEEKENLNEIAALTKSVEHIKEIVAMQQSYAKVSGAMATFDVIEIIEDAMKINLAAFARHQVKVVREFDKTSPVFVDRHKALQILINLFSNAKYALDNATHNEKRLVVQVRQYDDHLIRIVVADNGMGIAKENLVKIFNHGFTTRKEGHGFGLHSGANAAREMGGSLTVTSDGPAKGATFTLELPAASEVTIPRIATM
jgi:PAS domain S-box-containing protein